MHTTTTTTPNTNTTTTTTKLKKKTKQQQQKGKREGKSLSRHPLTQYKKKQDARIAEIDSMSFFKNSKVANGTPCFCAKHGDKKKKKSGYQNVVVQVWVQVYSLKNMELVYS